MKQWADRQGRHYSNLKFEKFFVHIIIEFKAEKNFNS